MMLNDDVFGNLEYDMSWDGKTKVTFLGKEVEVTLRVRGDESGKFLDTQKQAYTNFMNQQETLMLDVANGIFDYYNSVRDEYREIFGDDADIYAPIINSVDELAPLVKFTHLIVENFDEADRIILLLFKSKWDTDMGVGVMLRNEQIDTLGTQDDVL